MRVIRGSVEVDFAALQNRVQRFTAGVGRALAKNLAELGIVLFEGRGVCTAPGQVRVSTAEGDKYLAGEYIILACGTSSAIVPGLAPDGDCVLDSTGLLRIAEAPESLIIVGAGAIGIELGDFFSAMGTRVTLVEAAPHIAPLEDADVAGELLRALKKRGVVCHEGVQAKDLRTSEAQAVLNLANHERITAAKALVAVGRKPNTAGLGAEKAGCVLDGRGFVTVNSRLEASHNMYAVGDVNGMTLLAHAAEHQARYAANRILGRETGEYVSGPVPSCIYGSTEIMRVGQTAESLVRDGRTVECSFAPLSANPIAQASGGTAGFVKVVWEQGRIAGIAAVGSGVSHLVTVAQLLVKDGYTESKLHEVMFAHPTLDEIVPMAIRAPKVSMAGA
jgi:dihydrolipoamide dehydrogenase